jgi:hypothetical protein
MRLSPDEIAELTRLEEAMWTAATRFDATFQQERFGADFFEFGRSGRVYARGQAIHTGGGEIKARIPLDGLQIRRIDEIDRSGDIQQPRRARRRRGARSAQLDLDQDGQRLGDALSPGNAL